MKRSRSDQSPRRPEVPDNRGNKCAVKDCCYWFTTPVNREQEVLGPGRLLALARAVDPDGLQAARSIETCSLSRTICPYQRRAG